MRSKPVIILFMQALVLVLGFFAETQGFSTAPVNWAQVTLPPLDELEKFAVVHAGLDPKLIQQWQRGARWSAALPRIQLGWESQFINQNTSVIQDSISVTSSGVTVGPEANRLDLDLENNRGLEVKAIWALDELLFNRDQLAVSQEARDLWLVRSRFLQELHRAYYEIKSQLLQMQQSPSLTVDPLQQIRLEQLADQLNSMTGGEFKRRLSSNAPSLTSPQERKTHGSSSRSFD